MYLGWLDKRLDIEDPTLIQGEEKLPAIALFCMASELGYKRRSDNGHPISLRLPASFVLSVGEAGGVQFLCRGFIILVRGSQRGLHGRTLLGGDDWNFCSDDGVLRCKYSPN
jgi:hypothetical protein